MAELRLLLSVDKTADQYSGSLNSLDQDAIIRADVIRVEGDMVRLELKSINGVYEGKFDATHSTLTGTWTQGMSLPLAFTRDREVSAATAKPEQPINLEIPNRVQRGRRSGWLVIPVTQPSRTCTFMCAIEIRRSNA